MICSACGTENEPGRKFCSECGTRLALVCAACGTPNSVGAKYCGECAAPLPGGGPRAAGAPQGEGTGQGPTPVAERRLVSVLFADLVGFTTLAEGRDAEDVRLLLTHYFELARDVIGRYGGTVEKFIGDAVMAVWGAPTAHEDDAERAVRAALELVNVVRSLGPGIAARAGVLTGEAAVTVGSTDQGMVAGDLVNTASRLQSAAAPGTVLVGEVTQRAASRAIAFEAAGEHSLKGKTAPVPAWRAVRVVAEVGGRGRSEALEAPFVGRDDDLRLLKDLFHATQRERRTRLVSVIGPGGIGKSRLAWEFLKYADGLVDTVWWHDGRSPAYGDGISFWALGEMIRGRAGLLEGADEGTTRASVTRMLDTHVPDPDERRWIEPAILALLGIDDGSGSEQRFAAWRTFFERLAVTAPVVLVFEDFHFADSGLLDFVDHLLEWSRGVPIYVVTLARPELLDRRPDWGAAKRNFTSLYLEPLPEPVMRELLDGLVPGLPEPAVRAIVTRADGVPLYAVETVRMLLAEGSLTVEEGRYRPTGDLTSLAVPETLTALIASRLDSLTPEDRALVSDAAVLGQSFTLAGLASVSGIPEAELEARLRPLVRREFLTLEFDARSPERGQCAFVQALIREVAYNTLARRDRKIRHLAAARYFETLGSEELAGALAGHYLAAYQNAGEGAEADALAAQARIALRAAAERAINLGSLGQAVGFLDQARAVTRDPADVAELLERAGWAANNGSLNDVAEDRLRQAVELRRSLPDRDALAGAIAALGDLRISVLRREVALALLEPAVDELVGQGREPTGPGSVALLAQLCRAYFMLDRQRDAIAVADRALEAAERLDLAPIVADVLITRGSSLAKLGRAYEGGGAIRAAIELADERGLISTALRGRLNLGVMAGDPRAQLEASQDALEMARRYGLRGFVRVLIGNLASAALETGDWKLAAGELQAGLDESDDPLDANYLSWAATTFAAWRGEDVRAELTRLSAWAESFDEASARAAVFDLRGVCELGAGRFPTACDAWLAYAPSDQLNAANAYFYAGIAALLADDLERLRSALSGLDAIPGRARLSRVDRRLLEAGREALLGHRSEGLREGRAALVDYARLGLRWRQSLGALVLLATIGTGDPEVRAAADAARLVFEELGARPFLEMLEERLTAPLAPESDQVGPRAAPRTPVDASIDPP